jgi:hypothetical protein
MTFPLWVRQLGFQNPLVAELAGDVGGIVVILIVCFHHLEYHRLRLIAGGHQTRGNRASTSMF